MKKGEKFFKIAQSCTHLMIYLVNDMLDFSQIEAKKLIMNI